MKPTSVPLAALLSCLGLLAVAAPDAQDVSVQTVGDHTYFRARLAAPGLVPEGPLPWMEVRPELLPLAREWWPAATPDLTPRLVSSDLRQTCRVPDREAERVTVVGRVAPGVTTAQAVLHYPIRAGAKLAWKQVAVKLDLKTAAQAEGLERQWARGQLADLDDRRADAPDFGFYPFAITTLERRHNVSSGRIPATKAAHTPFTPERLYELTTGATAITESLQLRRGTAETARPEPRTIDVATLLGIEIAEHPWRKMMGGRKPAAEPLAELVPHDNYYVTFRDPAKLFEFAGLLETWGGNLTRAFEFTSRDYRLWQRYERQLCLAGVPFPGVQAVAITGNDAYLRDGTDITVLLRCANPDKLLAALDVGIAAARKEHAGRLGETTTGTRGRPTVDSFVTPLREVSLHRAVLDDVVVLSNSPVALRRVLDTAQGRALRLSDSLDFQYMRTVFRADDTDEDGFAYLPDAFIRAFVGPTARIKQKRRLEAQTSLQLLTHGALFAAWDTGKTPATRAELLRAAGLTAAEVALPDGEVRWDADQKAAHAGDYGSIHFMTPLVELDLGKVTAGEAREYATFRAGYLRLWRQFFDPIGMRLALRDGEIKLETYILPLIQSDFYNQLRRFTGNGTTRIDPAAIAPTTLFQYRLHLNPEDLRNHPQLRILGDWAVLRIDDGPEYAKLFATLPQTAGIEELIRRTSGLPLAAGIAVKDEKEAAQFLKQMMPLVPLLLAQYSIGYTELTSFAYKEVTVHRVRQRPAPDGTPPLPLNLHLAVFGDAAYVTLTETMMKRLIDEAEARKARKAQPLEQWPAFANSSVHLGPAAVQDTRPLLTRLAELPTHQEARSALATWQALYRGGIVAPDATPEAAAEAAFRFLGYVPTAPDRTPFRHDRDTGEMVNARHGSLREPVLADDLARTSPLARLLDNLRNVRVDLRFREDGIHTTLTLTRRAGGKGMTQAALLEKAIAALDAPDLGERVLAAQELAKWGLKAAAAIPALQAAQYAFDHDLRSAAAVALGKIEPDAARPERLAPDERKRILASLAAALRSTEPAQRLLAAETLGQFGPLAASAIPDLQAAQYGLEADVRAAAAAALARIDADAVRPERLSPDARKRILASLAEALRSPLPSHRTWAREVLPRFQPEGIAVLQDDTLLRALESRDLTERRWAITTALKLNVQTPAVRAAVVGDLCRELRQGLIAQRMWAAESLAALGHDASTALGDLRAASRTDWSNEVRDAAAAAIQRIERAAGRKP